MHPQDGGGGQGLAELAVRLAEARGVADIVPPSLELIRVLLRAGRAAHVTTPIVEGVLRLDDATGRETPGLTGIRSYLAVPMRTHAGEALGALCFGDPEIGVFDARAEALASAAAAVVGMALDRARMAADIEQLVRRTRLVNEATDEGHWYWDVAADTVDWNDALLAIHGFDRSGWAGTFEDWFSRVHPTDQPRLAAALQAHLGSRVPYRIDRFQLRHADGEYRWFTTAGQAAWDEHGKPICMAGAVRDITAQVTADEEHRANEHRYAQILDSVPDLVFCKDEHLALTYANAATCRYYGMSREELRGMTAMPANEIDFTQVYNRDDRDVLTSGNVIERRAEPNRAPGGQLHFFDTVKAPIRNEHGRVTELVGVSRDVTKRKREEEAQRHLAVASEILGRSIDYDLTLANVAEAVIPAFADWCAIDVLEGGAIRRVAVAHADRAMVELATEFNRRYAPAPDSLHDVPAVLRTGTPEMMTGLTDAMFVASARDAEHLAMMRALEIHSFIIVPLLSRGRTLGAITLVTQRERALDQHDLGFAQELARRVSAAFENALLYREVRELNAGLEARVAQRTAALTEASAELEAFSYMVSHDLRAPVRHVGAFADLLQTHAGDALDAEARHFIDRIKTASVHMGFLVDGLLSFSRLGRMELDKQPLSLSKVVSTVRDELGPELIGRTIDWEIGALPEVVADPTLMRVVISNLLGNAVKYTRTRPAARIEIGAKTSRDENLVWVRDNGAGFEMEYAHKLFGMFQRLHTDTEFEGTGVGLASARRAINRHGGRIWAEAALDRGATFYFTLPRAAI